MPKKVDHDSRWQSFVSAAYRTVRKSGVSGATVRAVAKEAGFTTGALVHYVDSMDRLLIDASRYGMLDTQRNTDKFEKLPDKIESLRQVLYGSLPVDKASKATWEFLIGLWGRAEQEPGLLLKNRARQSEWLKRITKLIEAAKAGGDIPENIDTSRATRVIIALIVGIAVQAVLAGPPISADEQRAIVDEWILNWLKPLRPTSTEMTLAKKKTRIRKKRVTSSVLRNKRRRPNK